MKLKKNSIKYGSSKRNPPTMNNLIKNMEKPSNMTTKEFNDLKKRLKENPQIGFNALQIFLQYSRNQNQNGGTGWSSYLPSFNYFTEAKNEEQDNINNVQNEKTRMNIASSVKEKGRKTRRTMVPSKIQNQYKKNILKRSTKNNVHYWGNYPQYVSPNPLFSNNPEYGSHAPLGITYQQPQPQQINPPTLQGSLLLGALLLGTYDKYYRTPNKKKSSPKKSSPKSSKKVSLPKSTSKTPSKKPLTPKTSYRQVSFPKIKTKTKTLKKL